MCVRVCVITQDYKVRRINPRHLVLAVRGDEELDTLMDKVVFPGGGVIPHIHKSLVSKRTPTLVVLNRFSI
jgi:histone H2A